MSMVYIRASSPRNAGTMTLWAGLVLPRICSMCRGNSLFIASATTPRDCSSGRFRPRSTALIQSAGSVPADVAPSPAYPKIATPSVVSRNMILRASSFKTRPRSERRRSAISQIVSGPLIVTTSVTIRPFFQRLQLADCRHSLRGFKPTCDPTYVCGAPGPHAGRHSCRAMPGSCAGRAPGTAPRAP